MLSSAATAQLRRLRAPGYLILSIALGLPLLELVLSLLPFRPDAVTWRFAAEGILSSAVAAPMLALLLIFAIGLATDDRIAVLAVALLAAILAVILIGGAGSFILDALEMRRRVNSAQLSRFTSATALATFKLVLQAIAGITLSIAAFRARQAIKLAPTGPIDPSSALIMGRPGVTRAAGSMPVTSPGRPLTESDLRDAEGDAGQELAGG